jgi:hypothetical protein
MRKIIFILMISIYSLRLGGQNQTLNNLIIPVTADSCLKILFQADRLFQEGYYDKCINDLNGILKMCSLARNDKEHAMELLSKAYLEVDNKAKADSVLNRMLIRFPHYESKDAVNNSEDFDRLLGTYRIHPRLSIGARNTAKWVYYKTTSVNTKLNNYDYTAPYEHISYAFMYYGWGEIEFNRGISINGDLIFFTSSYDRYFKTESGTDLHFWGIDNYTHIPVYLKKYFPVGKNILPYIAAGMSFRYMMNSKGNAYMNFTEPDSATGKTVYYIRDIYNVDMMAARNVVTWDWLAGAGIGYKIKNIRMFIDVRYYGGMNSFINMAKEPVNTSLVDKYYYVDNSVKLNMFEIGASISYTIINSVKKKKH